MSHYQTKISAILTESGRTTEPRIVEAWMRSECGTLDGLSPAEFRAEVLEGSDMADADPEVSRYVADCMGL